MIKDTESLKKKKKKDSSIQTPFNSIRQKDELEHFYCVEHNILKIVALFRSPCDQCGLGPQGVMRRTTQMFVQAPMQSVYNKARQTRAWCFWANLKQRGTISSFF